MFGRLYRIFLRYRDENLRLEMSAPIVTGAQGSAAAQIDRIVLCRNRLTVEGWTNAARIGLRLNRTVGWVTPNLTRPDESMRGFTLDLPFEPGIPELLTEEAGAPFVALPAFSGAKLFLARNRHWLPYIAAATASLRRIWLALMM